MARGFGSTFGAGTTDAVQTGYTATIGTSYSVSFWAWINGAGGNNLGRFVSMANDSVSVLMLNNTSNVEVAAPFTSQQGVFSFAPGATGRWHHYCVCYNGSSTANKPTVYVDGAAVSVSTVVTPVGTYNPSTGATRIGNSPGGSRGFDGKLAECALWNGSILTAAEAAALAAGANPLSLRPAALSFYLPLFGAQANEPDWGPSRVTQTITGTAKQNHPPVSFWMPPAPFVPPIFFKGALAVTQGAAAVALTLAEKFGAALALAANTAGMAITAAIKWTAMLALAAPARLVAIFADNGEAGDPGFVAVGAALQNTLTATHRTAWAVAANDAPLTRVTLTETIL